MKEILSTLKLEILEAKRAELDTSWNHSNVNSPFSRFYFIESGEGKVIHHDQEFILYPNHIYLMPAHTLLHTSCPDQLVQYYIHFKAELFSGLSLFHVFNPFYQVNLVQYPQMPAMIYRLFTIFPSKTIGETIEYDAIMRMIISLFYPVKSEQSKESLKAYQRFKEVLVYIENNLDKQMTLKELAKIVHLQPTYFSNLFCDCLGIPPIQYLNRKRIEKARELLLSTDDSIEIIAETIGFNDVFYFSRMFKKYTDLSPSSYRKQHSILIV